MTLGIPLSPELTRTAPRPTRIGLASGALGAHWRQFPGLLPQLKGPASQVAERLRQLDCDVVGTGFVSDVEEGAQAAERLRLADCDLPVGFLAPYLTVTILVPVAQRSGAPALPLILQPTEVMAHEIEFIGALGEVLLSTNDNEATFPRSKPGAYTRARVTQMVNSESGSVAYRAGAQPVFEDDRQSR